MKGRKQTPAFVDAKGGEIVKNSYEQRVRNQFGGFCTRVLKNEANRIYHEHARKQEYERSWENLHIKGSGEIPCWDCYFRNDHVFNVLGQPVVVVGDRLAAVLSGLPETEREIILPYFFLGLTDEEISTYFHVVRQTISKRRAAILKNLREQLKKEGVEWADLMEDPFRWK